MFLTSPITLFFSTTHLILFRAPDNIWVTILLWIVRITTFSLLFRTRIGPWLLTTLSSHISVKSVSLRSIRGVYFRNGVQTLRIERVSYARTSVNGYKRWGIKVDGLSLEIGKELSEDIKPPMPRHKRSLTLADLNPSPLARWLWKLSRSVYVYFEPYFRPIIRTYVVAFLRIMIRLLPVIIEALSFEFHSVVITFSEIPGTRIGIEEVGLHMALQLIQMERVGDSADVEQVHKLPQLRKGYGVEAWKKRLRDSFQRSLDRAWGTAHGMASVAFTLRGIAGMCQTESAPGGRSVPFFLSPGIIDLGVSARFNPRAGAMDPHSLETNLTIGDCSVKVDLVNTLLATFKLLRSQNLAKSKPSRNNIPPPLPLEMPSDSQFLSPNSPFSASPVMSATSSMFSPIEQSPSPSLLPPDSVTKPPGSPFLRAISASMRPRRRHYVQRRSRLKDAKNTSLLSILRTMNISISAISLSTSTYSTTGAYKAVIHSVIIGARLSDPALDPLHQEYLGRSTKSEKFDSDSYAFKFSVQRITLDRQTKKEDMRLLKLSSIDFQALASQWPSPWLVVSPFIQGSANSPLLAVRITVGSIHLTENLVYLLPLLNHVKPSESPAQDSTAAKATSYSIPKLSFELQCGPICARLVCGAQDGPDPKALELRTKSFLVSASNHFSLFTPTATQTSAEEHFSLQLNGRFDFILEPVLVRVRSKWMPYVRRAGPSDSDFLDDPAIISLEMFEAFGTVKGLAAIDSRPDGVASVEVASLLPEVHATCDAFCVELWHPDVIALIYRLLSLTQSRPKTPSTDPAPPSSPFDRLPVGASAKIALARFVVFITAPDINPGDTELLRGVALRTGIAVEFASMSLPLAFGVDHRQRSEARSKLYLPQECIMNAITTAKRSTASRDASLYLKASAFNLALRSAIATQYESDDPTIAGRDDVSHSHRDFIRVVNLQANVCFSRKQLFSPPAETYTCEVVVYIPYIRGDFKLAHVYSVLLALQTVRRLSPPSAQPQTKIKGQKSNVALRFQGTLKTIQIYSTFLKQRLVTRIDGLGATLHPHAAPVIRVNKVTAWSPIPPRIDPWQDGTGREKWEEILSLSALRLGLPVKRSGLIVVEGNGARLRIPHGFILADLIFDISVVAKALKHLTQITTAGAYSDMLKPEAEGPKLVPRVSIRFECFCLEAQDDPFESKLGSIWREGMDAAKQRIEREDAFLAKVAAIQAAELEGDTEAVTSDNDQDYQFTGKHSVTIEEARQRLDQVHVLDWTLRLEKSREQWANQEKSILHKLHGAATSTSSRIPNIIPAAQPDLAPPLFRVMLAKLSLTITPPSFPKDRLPIFMNQQGNGLPLDTEFSLLVPLHINLSLASLKVTLRDYPVPLINIAAHPGNSKPAFIFDTDLVIGEEMGTDLSIDWVQCPIVGPLEGAAPMSLTVPKTIMPVKSYACPVIHVSSPAATVLSWSVSYGPAIQDMMRIVDTLSSAPRDPSPVLGFWDKMRLVFHWNVKVTFAGDVRLYIKGSRNPYNFVDAGAGFVLCWQGSPELRIACKNDEGELVQVTSDAMFIAIPNLEHIAANTYSASATHSTGDANPFQKICAKFGSGIRFGIGFVLERSCGYECQHCSGTPFQRACRHFTFNPHYEVKLEKKPQVPERKGPEDSYNGFRSDFIHLSVSLTSSVRRLNSAAVVDNPSSLHLTPKAFAHFFAWWSLFDGVLTLPIRQGSYYPARMISPKLGRHLATLKYRVHVQHLFIMHGYMDDSRDTWVDGVTPWVGVKGIIDDFQADMHQREEEATVPGPIPDTTKVIRRKPFDMAEVVLKGIDLRAVLATFSEPLKQVVQMSATAHSNYRQRSDLPVTELSSPWYEAEDFVEVDWTSQAIPSVHLLPLATCPHFTYFKRNSTTPGNETQTSKFGTEDSHVCLLGKEPSVPQVQINLASARISELKQQAASNTRQHNGGLSLPKMVGLLEEYIAVLKEAESSPESASRDLQNYHMPSGIVSPDEWAEFDNVYQIHCPNIFMDSATRDIILQYYYCSRARRGFEYHMAARAVKFIRDQADAALQVDAEEEEDEPDNLPSGSNTAQIAATALRKILKGENGKPSVEISRDKPSIPSAIADPLSGWADGVSLQKNNCCLLLKPQLVMRGEDTKEACIVAAAQAKLQSYVIMDNSNLEDPISGKVMSRNYTSLSGLQTFSTTHSSTSGNGRVPLEVLIDLRCESSNFERLVPQTDAVFHYDKFNRLRLRNNLTSVVPQASTDKSASDNANHLQDQTDLIRVHIPRFTVSASDEHFQIISNIVTKLLLFSDAAHKTRLDRLETMLFTYDFADLNSAAGVISNLQSRLRDAMETERITIRNPRRLEGEEDKLGFMKLKAHIFLLAEELNFLFDAIKLAQDRFDDQTDRKSALLLHASSSEISWRMLDERRNLLAKLVVQDSNFYWLSRQDSSTVNNLTIGNLTAFDGSRHALWAEILSKHYEPANHRLLKRGLFLLASWTILPPVGGITIYEAFEVSLHPLRLQVDAKVGRRIMAYVWPARKQRIEDAAENPPVPEVVVKSPVSRSSMDSPRTQHNFNNSIEPTQFVLKVPPTLRKLGSSRSFTDLRATKDSSFLRPPTLQRTRSSTSLLGSAGGPDAPDVSAGHEKNDVDSSDEEEKKANDAAVMKTRSSQKTFVLVKISSLDLLLSVVKEGSFECHDAKIKTRELEYRNQTWSFEELVNQFIPSNMGWKGWVKMVFQQPLVPVLPVARELISKTKWTASKGAQPHEHPLQLLHPGRILASDDDSRLAIAHGAGSRKPTLPPQSQNRGWLKGTGKSRQKDPTPSKLTSLPLTDEPEPLHRTGTSASSLVSSRKRMLSLFSRGSQSSKSDTSRNSDDKSGSNDSSNPRKR